jgi:PGF-CTERM protein
MSARRVATVLALLTVFCWATVPPVAAVSVDGSPVTATDIEDRAAGASVGSDGPAALSRFVAPSTTVGASGAAQSAGTVNVTNRLALTPSRAGEISVTTEVDSPDSIVNLTVYLPAAANVTATDGFGRVNETAYRTDDATATVTYRLPANRSRPGAGPEGGGASGDYVFVDAGEWALVQRPAVALSWYARGAVSVNRSLAVDGEGAAGTSMAFLGPHRTVTRTAHGQRFDLIVPEAASMVESPSTVLASLVNASGDLQVGDRDDRVFAIAAPATVSWGVAGLQTGDTDFWVAADQRLNESNNVWLHEYVHTRQAYTVSEATRWTIEGWADYYGALLALEGGHVTFEQFREKLREGRADGVRSAVLTNTSDWTGYANYYKGALVAGELDRRVRLASDRERTFQRVWRSMNDHDGEVSQSDFLGYVADAGNESVRTTAERFTDTSDAPSPWSRRTHLAAYGTGIGSLSYRFDGSLDVNGRYRNGTLNGSTVRVVPGERVTATAVAANDDTTAHDYNLSVWLDDSLLAATTGRLDGGATATLSANSTLDERGDYALTTGSETITVSVVDPANVTVAAVSLNRTTLQYPGTVGVSVAVRNGQSIPADDTLVVTVDGRAAANRTVRLAPGAVGRVTVPVRIDGVGNHTVGVAGGATKNVTVEATRPATAATTTTSVGDTATQTATTDRDPTPVGTASTATADVTTGDAPTATGGPGFGVVVALAGLSMTVLRMRRRVD